MAEKFASSAEILEDLLRCMVCFDTFKSPKVLHCQHTFCEDCIRKWNGKGGGGNKGVSCPTCRMRTPLPDKGIPALPSDFKVSKLGELVKQVSIQESMDNRSCDICAASNETKEATHFCAQCVESLCSTCLQRHNANSLFTNHHVVDLSVEASSGKLFCKAHTAKPIKYRCQQCNVFICTVCAINVHNDHDVQDLEAGLRDHTDTLKALLGKIQEKIRFLKTTHEELTEIKVLLKGQHDDLEDIIEGHIDSKTERIMACQQELLNPITEKDFGPTFNDISWAIRAMQHAGSQAITQQASFLINNIKDSRRHLLEDLKVKYTNTSKDISDQTERLEFHLGSIESMACYLEKMLAFSNALELLTIYEDLIARVESVINTEEDFSSPSLVMITFNPEGGEHQVGELVEEKLGTSEYLERLQSNPDTESESDVDDDETEESNAELLGATGGFDPSDSEPLPSYAEACGEDLEAQDEILAMNEFDRTVGLSAQEEGQVAGRTERQVAQETGTPNSGSQTSRTSTMSSTTTTFSTILDDSRDLRMVMGSSESSLPIHTHSTSSQENHIPNSKDDSVLQRQGRDIIREEISRPRSVSEVHSLQTDPLTAKDAKNCNSNLSKIPCRPKSSCETGLGDCPNDLDDTKRGSFSRSVSMPESPERSAGPFTLLWEKEGSGKLTSMKKGGSGAGKRKGGTAINQSGLAPEIRNPTDVTFMPNGEVIVADAGDKNLQVLTMDTKIWSRVKDRKQPLVTSRPIAWNQIEPVSVVVAPSFNQELAATFPAFEGELVVITDEKDKCVKMIDTRNKGSCVATWGKSWFSPMFKHPSGLAVTKDGKWIITDIGKHCVSLHDADGRCLQSFGSKGKGGYGFEFPRYVAVDEKDRILVSDSGNGGIKVYDHSGEFLFKIGVKDSTILTCPAGICIDNDGNILVAERSRHSVIQFSPDGRFIKEVLTRKSVHCPTGIAMAASGHLVVTQTDPASVKLFEPTSKT